MLLKEAREHSDTVLVEECRQGDSRAFDELVRRYKDRVYNAVYRFLGNREDALDVSQEVFVRAYRGVADFRGHAKISTWLYSIAANLARNRLRDSHRKGRNMGISLDALEDVVAHQGQTPRAAAESKELAEMLQRCLNELPDHYRAAFVLRTFEDLSYEEIAESLDCPLGTVKSRINQARTLLRTSLQEAGML